MSSVPSQQPLTKPQSSPPAQAAQTQSNDEKIQAEINKTAQATINWDKSSTSGIKVQIILIDRGTLKGQPKVNYRLKVAGAPSDKLYTLVAWPVTFQSPVDVMDGLAVSRDGTVSCPADSTKSCAAQFKGNELHIILAPEIGEIFRFALVSEDRQARAFFSVVPAPMIQPDKACSLEAVRLSPHFELVLIRGRGFKPGEDVSIHTQSYQDAHNVPMKADAQGEFNLSITPFVKGRTTGIIDITAKAAGCAPTISFNWGL
ncbi:MAG TPA: hypothetical protein VEW69_09740 [Alphaproteobacteria bacterium]|nr:hypothetical protein [Alphaproteobacteria bacterium]